MKLSDDLKHIKNLKKFFRKKVFFEENSNNTWQKANFLNLREVFATFP